MNKLKESGHFFVETVRVNRLENCRLGGEKEFFKKRRGSVDYRCEKTTWIVAVRWMDNKEVTCLSSCVGVEPKDKVKRWDRSKKQYIEEERPSLVNEYNKFRGGIDTITIINFSV